MRTRYSSGEAGSAASDNSKETDQVGKMMDEKEAVRIELEVMMNSIKRLEQN